MVFSTTIFLFLFLPVFLGGYYLSPFRARSAWILLGSWVFYGWWRLDFLGLLILSTVWTYLLGGIAASGSAESRPQRARIALVVGVVLNLGSLAYFKYFNFAVDSLNYVLSAAGGDGITAWNVILPIGISFYVFQATSYLIDVYRGDAPAARSYLDLAAYIALFPQLIAGPILRYKDLADQLRRRTHSFSKFSEGSYRFMIGFCKKVLIADTVALIADVSFGMEQPGLLGAWLGALAYSSQLYFDFSGYSDMAIGLGLMMGFRFMENFDYPYISRSITEFWRRWHMSLSTWLRDYLYIPLGGNKRGPLKTYRNVLLVMLLGGLWHGAAWTFVVWGAWHGGILAFERYLGNRRAAARGKAAPGKAAPGKAAGTSGQAGARQARVAGVFALVRTMFLVLLGWVVFRAPDFTSALRMYGGLFGLQGIGPREVLQVEFGLFPLAILALSLLLVYIGPYLKGRSVLPAPADAGRVLGGLSYLSSYGLAYARLFLIPLFLLGVLKLAAESFSPFLYFQF
ncbi:MAG: MBOAT family protein [Spirochaetia bacterium]